ncbi:MAG: hypothetical protein RL398_1003 [Planctomycetota bacterium]|jgi:hypothetical protein
MNTEAAEGEVLARVRCRTFRGSHVAGVLVPAAVGWSVLMVLLMLGVPPLLAGVAFVALVVWGILRGSGPTDYTLTATHVRREYRSFFGGASLRQEVAITALRSWRRDRELSRGLDEYEYLALELPQGARWVVTGRQEPAAFAAFADAFERCLDPTAVSGLPSPQPPNQQPLGQQPPKLAPTGQHPPPPPLPVAVGPRRRGSFYRSWAGRALAVLFAGCSVLLLLLLAGGYLNAGHVLRLLFVILPGTAYLCWRAFVRR